MRHCLDLQNPSELPSSAGPPLMEGGIISTWVYAEEVKGTLKSIYIFNTC